jgi:hypothetical protein
MDNFTVEYKWQFADGECMFAVVHNYSTLGYNGVVLEYKTNRVTVRMDSFTF